MLYIDIHFMISIDSHIKPTMGSGFLFCVQGFFGAPQFFSPLQKLISKFHLELQYTNSYSIEVPLLNRIYYFIFYLCQHCF